MKETNISKSIQLYVSKFFPSTTLFRNNTAQGWAGKILKRTPGSITLANPFPLHAGLTNGSSDLIGITSVKITPEMVGQIVGVFTGFEVKTEKGKVSDDQKKFIAFIKSKGGICGVVRSENDVGSLLNNPLPL